MKADLPKKLTIGMFLLGGAVLGWGSWIRDDRHTSSVFPAFLYLAMGLHALLPEKRENGAASGTRRLATAAIMLGWAGWAIVIGSFSLAAFFLSVMLWLAIEHLWSRRTKRLSPETNPQ
jgi:hypothetical protein